MADTKITALTAITTVDPAVDVLPIVDVSDTSMAASGTTKKITSNQILGAGGTATLASATITGDLTVRTNKLKVTSIGVGAGTTTPAAILHSTQTTSYDALILDSDSASTYCTANWKVGGVQKAQAYLDYADDSLLIRTNTATGPLKFGCNNILQHRIDPLGVFNWYDGAGGTRMTLNANGLGIGVTPSAWRSTQKALQIGAVGTYFSSAASTGSTCVGRNVYESAAGNFTYIVNDEATFYEQTATGTHAWYTAAAGTGTISFGDAKMTLDASGNLLVGKTATNSGTVGVEIQPNGNVWATKSASTSAATAWDTYSTGAGAYRFYVGMNGTINATNTTISAISDARLKENVQDIDVGLGAILALKPRKFDWKAGKGKDIKGDRGFIAQEFEQVFPNLIDEWKDPAPEGEAPYKSVRQDLIPVLVKAIQELTARVQTLETR